MTDVTAHTHTHTHLYKVISEDVLAISDACRNKTNTEIKINPSCDLLVYSIRPPRASVCIAACAARFSPRTHRDDIWRGAQQSHASSFVLPPPAISQTFS